MVYACADSGGAAKNDSSRIDRRMMFLAIEVIVIASQWGARLLLYEPVRERTITIVELSSARASLLFS